MQKIDSNCSRTQCANGTAPGTPSFTRSLMSQSILYALKIKKTPPFQARAACAGWQVPGWVVGHCWHPLRPWCQPPARTSRSCSTPGHLTQAQLSEILGISVGKGAAGRQQGERKDMTKITPVPGDFRPQCPYLQNKSLLPLEVFP